MNQKFPQYQMGYESIQSFVKDHHHNETSPFVNHEFIKFVVENFEEIQRIPELDLPKGIIHGDLFMDNLIFNDEKLLGIIDFEDVSQMELVYDVAMTIIGNCFHGSTIDLELLKSFMDSYQTVRKLTNEEIKVFPSCLRWAATAISIWRFKKFNMQNADDKHKERYLIMVNISRNLNDKDILKIFE